MPGSLLQGHVAIVTGSDSGIGQATAIAFGQEGTSVAITYFQDEAGAQKTLEKVMGVENFNRKAFVTQLDVRDPASVARLFEETERQLGPASILVNNAGVNYVGKRVEDLTHEEWHNVIQTNLYGPFYCCQEFLRRYKKANLMRNSSHGSIINITSVHEDIASPGAAEYDAAKGGLRNLTTTLALEVAETNIRVNNLAPGLILTPMNQEDIDDPKQLEQHLSSVPLKRAGEPWEIARAAVFLASEDAAYIHGTTLFVDGGMTIYHGK